MSTFDRFTERAREVLKLAQEEALSFNHSSVGTEHLLLGMVHEGDGVAARVLSNMGVQLPKVRSAVEFIDGRGEEKVEGGIKFTQRSRKVLELAVDESRRFNHPYIGTEHLLLGLIREGEGIAVGILESLGVDLQKMRENVLKALEYERSPADHSDLKNLGLIVQSIPLFQHLLLSMVDQETIFNESIWRHLEVSNPKLLGKVKRQPWMMDYAQNVSRAIVQVQEDLHGKCSGISLIFLMSLGVIQPTDHVRARCPLCSWLYEGFYMNRLASPLPSAEEGPKGDVSSSGATRAHPTAPTPRTRGKRKEKSTSE